MTRKKHKGPIGGGADARHAGANARQSNANVRRGDTTAAALSRLRGGLTGERSLIGVSYMDDPAMLRAYLEYFWPVSREQARVALSVSRRFARGTGVDFPGAAAGLELDAPFRRVIDVGSGPGPVAAAFVDGGATEVALLDQSERALTLARATIAERCVRPAAVRALVADIASPDPARIPLWGTADCVSFSHCLNELWAGADDRVERRADLLARYALALAPGGLILVIEPALLGTSRDLLAVRNLLVERGWYVRAPCPGRARLPCPALAAGEGQTCHEEIAWIAPRSVAARARDEGVEKDSLKMTWFMLAPPAEANGAAGTGASDGARAVDAAYRVVSDPMLNKGGRVRRLLCGSLGRFPLSAPEGGEDARRSGFDRLRRGDVVAVSRPEPRENGWGVGADTELSREIESR